MKKKHKIYTKGGDTGETSLIGGKRVKKYSLRIEAYGTVDELISMIAFARGHDMKTKIKKNLLGIENHLMIIASHLAGDPSENAHKLPALTTDQVLFLEKQIDRMEKKLAPLSSFVLPGGNAASSVCHLARTICRRAERRVCELAENEKIEPGVLIYLNRLSDYLFVLSRKVLKDSAIKDELWLHDSVPVVKNKK